MKIGIIIPDKNDRPHFLKNCLRMIEAQSVKPDIIELVNQNPIDIDPNGYVEPGLACDITFRYRTGYERLRNKGLDGIFLMENEDGVFNKIVFITILTKKSEDNFVTKYNTVEGYTVSVFKDDDNEIIKAVY